MRSESSSAVLKISRVLTLTPSTPITVSNTDHKRGARWPRLFSPSQTGPGVVMINEVIRIGLRDIFLRSVGVLDKTLAGLARRHRWSRT